MPDLMIELEALVETLGVLLLMGGVALLALGVLVLLGQMEPPEPREPPGDWVHPARRGPKDPQDPKARREEVEEALLSETLTRATGTTPESTTATTPEKGKES